MSKAMTFAATAVALAIGFVVFWYLLPKTTSFGMFGADNDAKIGRVLLSFSATILGVVLGSFYRQLRQLQIAGQTSVKKPRRFISEMFRSIDMWLGLVGSPIVYALLLQSTAGMTLPGLLLVALENGFCCLIIINGFVGKLEEAAAPSKQ
jgi:hypothetical protein